MTTPDWASTEARELALKISYDLEVCERGKATFGENNYCIPDELIAHNLLLAEQRGFFRGLNECEDFLKRMSEQMTGSRQSKLLAGAFEIGAHEIRVLIEVNRERALLAKPQETKGG